MNKEQYLHTEFLINKVLDVKPLLPFIIKEYANSLTKSNMN